MREKRNNQRQTSKLLRILENLIDFELIICGYQTPSSCKKMQEFVRDQTDSDRCKVLDIDLSKSKEVYNFQNSLPKNPDNPNAYYVINIIGLESKIEPDKPCGFLNGLNLQRDRLAEQSPYTFIFWLPECLIKRFTLDAPDLWSWRNSVLVFMDEGVIKGDSEITSQESYTDSDFSNFTIKEKRRHMEYLADLITKLTSGEITLERQKKTAQAIIDQGELFSLTGEYNNALNSFKECKELWEKLGDQKMVARSCNKIGVTFFDLGNYKDAMDFLKIQEQISKELEDKCELSRSYGNQALILNAWGKLEQAMELHKKAEKICEELGDTLGLSISWWNQGIIYGESGDRGRQIELWRKSIDMKKSIGIPTESNEDALNKFIGEG